MCQESIRFRQYDITILLMDYIGMKVVFSTHTIRSRRSCSASCPHSTKSLDNTQALSCTGARPIRLPIRLVRKVVLRGRRPTKPVNPVPPDELQRAAAPVSKEQTTKLGSTDAEWTVPGPVDGFVDHSDFATTTFSFWLGVGDLYFVLVFGVGIGVLSGRSGHSFITLAGDLKPFVLLITNVHLVAAVSKYSEKNFETCYRPNFSRGIP
ncbi:hypothetical protein AG1IA_08258 [Rhizoctonia solani AG-1 IA]|uniref:Uncharacterized protein n=1 Tax=Thanatephorus cucumeris (strain AG1-IA) TaxID=983506 RepID=L8WHL1_THACA|nr:hypothetical protein AG1IA_08258 [Rhizoctonia solani AG-1 IA]